MVSHLSSDKNKWIEPIINNDENKGLTRCVLDLEFALCKICVENVQNNEYSAVVGPWYYTKSLMYPNDQSFIQSINQSINQPTSQLANPWTNQPNSQLTMYIMNKKQSTIKQSIQPS